MPPLKTIDLTRSNWVIWAVGETVWSRYHALEKGEPVRLACGRKPPKGKRLITARPTKDFAMKGSKQVCHQCVAIWNRSRKRG